MRAYIGFDEREAEAARVAEKTLRETSGLEAEFLKASRLSDAGLLSRISDHRGQWYDLISNAPKSTEFAVSRFLVPLLCQSGYALFTDCDVVFMRDVRDLLYEVDPRYAVSVVKHDLKSVPPTKMNGQINQPYSRKLWSSVMLFNCDHPANKRLSLHDINTRPGRDLHALYWLHHDEIGELNPRWNVLIGIDDIPDAPGILHWTLGGPFTSGWKGGPHDDIWLKAAA